MKPRGDFFFLSGNMAEKMMVEKLNDHNYSYWSQKMKFLLMKDEIWDVVSDGAAAANPQRNQDGQKALAIICLHVEDCQLIHTENAVNGREAWEALRTFHHRNTIGQKVRLLSRLLDTKISKGASMSDHLRKMNEILSQLRAIGAPIDDSFAVSVIMRSVSDEYQVLVASMEAWTDERLTLANVSGKLIEEWERLKERQEVETAFAARAGGSFRGNRSGNRNVWERLSTRRPNKQPRFECYYCQEIGHLKRDCPLYILEKSGKQDDNNNNANNVNNATNVNKESARMTRMGNWQYSWCFDSGASSHMCNDLRLFTNIHDYDTKEVLVANGTSVVAEGVGNVTLCILVDDDTPMRVNISNVLYVPELDENLISVYKLSKNGFTILFQDDNCFLIKGDDKILVAEYFDGLYRVKVECKEQVKSVVEKKSRCIHEWHRILAHRNLSDIKTMGRQGVLTVRECSCDFICEPCIRGKLSKMPFKTTSNPAKNVLDCIASDLGGPFSVESIGKSLYYITFTDLYSGYCDVFPIRSKSETPSVVKRFIEKVKNLTGKKPKVFRSDRGKEYLNKDLQDYLADEGIKFECTVGYAPQQNGTAERQNRTLMEATRTVLADSGLPKKFWAEAIKYVAFVNNRLINSRHKKSPLELFYNKKPKYNDMYPFGSAVYVMIPGPKRRKLDDKAEKAIFVGHDESAKGYRVANPETHKITISREVVFLKNGFQSGKNDVSYDLDFSFFKGERENETESDDDESDGSESHGATSDESESESDEFFDTSPQELRRSSRTNFGQQPRRFNDYYVYNVRENNFFEPRTYKEAISCYDRDLWVKAMEEELTSIRDNGTWEETDLPCGRKTVGSKWVFKLKHEANEKTPRYKARLVAQGFSQKYGTDYDEVFAPVARPESFRIMLTVASERKLHVRHFDFKTAFLNGTLKEEIYLRPPLGVENNGKVFRLRKSLYGLKQAAKVWNDTIHGALVKCGCVQSRHDKCLYSIKRDDSETYLIIHVDDLLIATNNSALMDGIVNQLKTDFELKDLGEASHYLGIDIERRENGTFTLSQEKYIEKILEESGLADGKGSKYPLDPGYYKINDEKFLPNNEKYRKLIGMLLYLSTNTRPDISASVSILSQKVSKPTVTDLNEVTRVIRYLKMTKNLKLHLGGPSSELIAHSDANWGEDRADRKSNSGYVVTLNGGAISWCCRKQNLVTLSSAEAEYVAICETVKEVMWLSGLVEFFDVFVPKPVTVMTDSQSCVAMVKDSKYSSRTKHMDIKYQYTKDMVRNGEIKLQYVSTVENIADMMTKPLGPTRIQKLRKMIGVEEVIKSRRSVGDAI